MAPTLAKRISRGEDLIYPDASHDGGGDPLVPPDEADRAVAFGGGVGVDLYVVVPKV